MNVKQLIFLLLLNTPIWLVITALVMGLGVPLLWAMVIATILEAVFIGFIAVMFFGEVIVDWLVDTYKKLGEKRP